MNYKQKLLNGMVLGLLWLSWQGAVEAQQQQEEAAETVVEEQGELRLVMDLGYFQVKDYRPTRNETVKLAFQMHVALNEYANEHTVEQLEFWKHRLRNQVLIAVRLSYRKDFLEAGLQHFRHLVQLRINRLLKMDLIDEVLLTEFTFTTD
jgi:flagellar basal body-associated protein FliL